MTQPDIMILPLEGGGEVSVTTTEEPVIAPNSDLIDAGETGAGSLSSPELALATEFAVGGHEEELAHELAADSKGALSDAQAEAKVIDAWHALDTIRAEETLVEVAPGLKSIQHQLKGQPARDIVEESSILQTGEWAEPLVEDAASNLSQEEQDGYAFSSLHLADRVDAQVAHFEEVEEDPTMLSPVQGAIALMALDHDLHKAVESEDVAGQLLCLAAQSWVMRHTAMLVTHTEWSVDAELSELAGQPVLAAVQ